ncbi:BnaC02g47570D [Brassica napus]|uniref:(rape) hypothetical protein n=1 Tax=Brassica napus TaxID=3708 RepID=A0A078JJH8_BRANA|nr:unnamed protein product [Brassica napus]CDY66869.1 BnaC02g47570D [Brassica napus]
MVGRDHLIFGIALHLLGTFFNVIMIVEIMTEELVDLFKHTVMLKKRGDTELIESNDAEEISLEGDRSVLQRQLDAYSQACDDQQTPGAKRHGQPVCFGFLVR